MSMEGNDMKNKEINAILKFVLSLVLVVGIGLLPMFTLEVKASFVPVVVDGLSYTIRGGECIATLVKPKGEVKYSGVINIPEKIIVSEPANYAGEYDVKEISEMAFDGSTVEKVVIPKSVTSISLVSFHGGNVKQIEVDEDNPSFRSENNCLIDKNNILYFAANAATVTVPNGVVSYKTYAFADCKDMTTLSIPASFTGKITGQDFPGDGNLSSISIHSDNSLYKTDNGVVVRKSNNAVVAAGPKASIIPSGATSIENSAYYGNRTITNLTIPDSVTSIGDNAFIYSKVSSVVIPASVTAVGRNVFFSSHDLVTIEFQGSTPPSVGSNAFPSENVNIIVPAGAERAYHSILSGDELDQEPYEDSGAESSNDNIEEIGWSEALKQSEQELDVIIEKLAKSELTGKQTIYLEVGDSLPYRVIKKLEENPLVTIDFKYQYEGVDYHVLVNGSKHKMDPKDEWAGPLYLFKYYGVK